MTSISTLSSTRKTWTPASSPLTVLTPSPPRMGRSLAILTILPFRTSPSFRAPLLSIRMAFPISIPFLNFDCNSSGIGLHRRLQHHSLLRSADLTSPERKDLYTHRYIFAGVLSLSVWPPSFSHGVPEQRRRGRIGDGSPPWRFCVLAGLLAWAYARSSSARPGAGRGAVPAACCYCVLLSFLLFVYNYFYCGLLTLLLPSFFAIPPPLITQFFLF